MSLAEYHTERKARLERLGFRAPAVTKYPLRQPPPSSGDAAVPIPQEPPSSGTAAPLPPPAFEIPITAISRAQTAVCRRYGISLADLLSMRRTQNMVRPRHVAMYLATRFSKHGLSCIGRRFGGRHHTTILHARDKIAHQRKYDEVLDGELIELEEILEAQL